MKYMAPISFHHATLNFCNSLPSAVTDLAPAGLCFVWTNMKQKSIFYLCKLGSWLNILHNANPNNKWMRLRWHEPDYVFTCTRLCQTQGHCHSGPECWQSLPHWQTVCSAQSRWQQSDHSSMINMFIKTANKDLQLQLSGFLRIKLLVVLDTDDELPALLDDRRRDLRKSYGQSDEESKNTTSKMSLWPNRLSSKTPFWPWSCMNV